MFIYGLGKHVFPKKEKLFCKKGLVLYTIEAIQKSASSELTEEELADIMRIAFCLVNYEEIGSEETAEENAD